MAMTAGVVRTFSVSSRRRRRELLDEFDRDAAEKYERGPGRQRTLEEAAAFRAQVVENRRSAPSSSV